jgi:hypothetical protein
VSDVNAPGKYDSLRVTVHLNEIYIKLDQLWIEGIENMMLTEVCAFKNDVTGVKERCFLTMSLIILINYYNDD